MFSRLQRTEFRGTERYELGEPLGAGGMGVVYSAFDRELQMRVALKCLPATSPAALLRFKNEFRALQDVQHENLVRLGELVLAGGQLFFTMEAVDGVDIVSHCRGVTRKGAAASEAAPAAPDDQTLDGPERENAGGAETPGARRAAPGADIARIYMTFAQLTRGLMALHAARKVHCDVKPSNVLVTAKGRVVLLDFGIVADLYPAAEADARLIGTAWYMAPEQAAKLTLGPAADFYALGVMLFEALTGELPFEGAAEQVLRRKRAEPAPDVLSRTTGLPRALGELCNRLLEREPERRPSGEQILRVFESDALAQREVLPRAAPPLLGRDHELLALSEALGKARRGELSVAHIEGQPGIGKTALLRQFIEGVKAAEDVLVLTGRCSEREYVPYRAIDGVVDGLASAMTASRSAAQRSALERRRRDVSRAFPAFGRCALGPEAVRPLEIADPHVQRLALFSALRELIAAVRSERLVLLALDDMHWADADSLALLSALVRPPGAPAILLLLASRPYWPGRSLVRSWGAELLELSALGVAESEALASRLLVQSGTLSEAALELAPQIAREAGGHPLFIDELVQQAARVGAQLSGGVSFEAALCARADLLPPSAQNLLQLSALSGNALPLRVLAAAAANLAGLAAEQVGSDLRLLRHAHLLRFDGTSAQSRVEPYHERVGAALRSRLSADVARRLHEALAHALEAEPQRDAEELAVHWRGAGELARASHYALQAADGAGLALAFERAARLYQMALECGVDPEQRSVILEKLGDALGNAGRGRVASKSYLDAAFGAGELRRFDLECRAADQLLRTGHVDEAEPLIVRVLSQIGMRLPRTAFLCLLVLLFARLRLRLRGYHVATKPLAGGAERNLVQLNACWTIAVGLSMVDNIRGACLQSRHLLLALRAGQPLPLLKAIAVEAGYVSVTGQRARRRAEQLLARAEEIAEQIGDPYASGFTTLSKAICSFLMGEWQRAHSLALQAERVFEARPAGALWELASARTFGLWSSFYMGDLLTMRARVPAFIQEAETRGDRYAATLHRTGLVVVSWLASDEPQLARRQVLEAQTGWSRVRFDFQCYLSTLGNCLIDLYEGAPGLAHRRMTELWPALSRSLYLRFQNMRVEASYVRGVSAITAAVHAVHPERLLRDADWCAKKILRERVGWATPLGAILRGGVAEVRGQHAAAREYFQIAEAHAQAHGMMLFAAAARFRSAVALGGETGGRLAHEVRAALSSRGIREPDRLCDLLAPGAAPARLEIPKLT